MKSRVKNRKVLATLISILSGSVGVNAVADDTGEGQGIGTKGGSTRLEEVIVTATKKQTSLQETAGSISAFSADMLQSTALDNVTELANFTPGLTASTNVGGTYAIRGISSDLLSISADSSIATYVDGVYISRQVGNQIPFSDIERVEVLRGPQGTTYGRNATGGVIHFVTKAPTDTFEGTVSAEAGNLDRLGADIMLSGPIVDDNLFFRVSAATSKRDGYVKNIGPGGGIYNDEDYESYRGKLLYQASENLDITIAGDYFRQRQDFPTDQVLVLTSAGEAAGAILPTSSFQAAVQADLVDTFDNRDLYGVSATIDWTIPDLVDIKSITAYRDSDAALFTDDDATTLFVSHVFLREQAQTFSQEIYAYSNGDSNLGYLIGASFLSEDTVQDLSESFAPGQEALVPADGDTTAWAIYGQLDYDLTDRINVAAGLRFSSEKRALSNSISIDDGITNELLFESGNLKESWSAATPNFLINFQMTDDTLIYALAARGFKSGGFASIGTSVDGFDPEFVWNFEGGLKTAVWDGRALLNMSAFYADYTDLQRRTGTSLPTLELVNAASAEIFGAEFELTLLLTDAWRVQSSYAYLSAEYAEFETVLSGDTESTDLAGESLDRSPEHSFSLISSYEMPIGSLGSLEWLGSVTYQSAMTFQQARESSLYEQQAFALVNASVTYFSNDRNWSLQLYGRNLRDKQHFLNLEGDPGSPALVSGYSALPRTYGVRLRRNF